MEKFYYKITNNEHACLSECYYLNDGTMVGSMACCECEHLKEVDSIDHSIRCKVDGWSEDSKK
jgi:hypothetical protein